MGPCGERVFFPPEMPRAALYFCIALGVTDINSTGAGPARYRQTLHLQALLDFLENTQHAAKRLGRAP